MAFPATPILAVSLERWLGLGELRLGDSGNLNDGLHGGKHLRTKLKWQATGIALQDCAAVSDVDDSHFICR